MDNHDAITASIGGAVAIVLSAAAYGLRDVVSAYFKRAERRLSAPARERYAVGVAGLKNVIKFWEILEATSRLTFIDRILLFSGQNHGGTPAAGKAYNVCCNWAYCVNKDKHPEQIYAGPLRVDSHYVKMLLDMIQHGALTLTTREMHPDSMLRGYYETEGVVQSRLHFLSFDEAGTELLFCTLANYSRQFTPNEIRQIDMVADRLRGFMAHGSDSPTPH